MAVFLFHPPESSMGVLSRYGVRPIMSQSSSIRGPISFLGILWSMARQIMFSLTEMSLSKAMCCWTTPIRRRASSAWVSVRYPPTETLPSEGFIMVVSIFTVVVFPAPLGPRNP